MRPDEARHAPEMLEQLGDSDERFRLLAEAMPQIVCVLQPDGAAEYLNRTWVEFSGMDRAATNAAGWAGVLHPDDLPVAADCRIRVLKRQAPQEVELRYRAADGSYRWFLSRLAPVVENGRVVRLVGAAMDIEGRKRAEERLRRAEAEARRTSERYATFFSAVREGFAHYAPVRDTTGQIVDVRVLEINPEGARLSGLPRDAQIGRTFREAWPGVDPRVFEHYREADRTGTAVRFEDEVALTGRVYDVVIQPASGDFVVTFTDITDRKRIETDLRKANEALREADRRKDEFLGMLSHELRNPLAPIRNSLYILDYTEADGQQARHAKEVANRQIAHMTRLVDDLLDVTRIARGKIQLRRADFDLAALARRTAEDHRAVMQGRHLALEVLGLDHPVIVNGDETRLAQVLGNLLHNAAKFTPAGGRVTLSVAREDRKAVVRVRDTGAGISREILPTIFEPFTQAKQTLARSEGGLGLGLALVKGLVALHDGDVVASSRGPGAGTEFVVTLPASAPGTPEVSARGSRRATPQPRQRRVLVIDDNHDAADSLAELVTMSGHRADVAYDALDGLQKVADGLPDVVLCDIGLPGMDGYEFARQLRSRSSSHAVRLVAVSGYAQPDDIARAVEAGFDAHVAKPPDPEEITALLG